MKNKKIISVILSIVLTLGCFPVGAFAGFVPDEPEYAEGEIVISSKKALSDSHGLLFTASESDEIRIDFEENGINDIKEVETYTDEENVYVAEVDGDIEKICKELNESEDVIAEPNYIFHSCEFSMPNELTTSFYKTYEKSYYDNILKIPAALEKYHYTGAGVTVAIIDNGFNHLSKDFPKNLWKNSEGTVGWNVNEDNDDIMPIMQSDGTSSLGNSAHGSNVAGIIGMAPNGSGGIGAAYGAELMLIQAAHYVNDTSQSEFYVADLVKAIDFARNNGADIINLSLGTTTDSSSIRSAINRAYNAGITIIAAAGNNGLPSSSKIYYPAAYSNVIGVMAVNNENPTRLADFSNYDTTRQGTYYDIAAPGVNILGCAHQTDKWTALLGTSQAAPFVSAAAAVYFEQNPDATPLDFKTDLLASSTDLVYAFDSTSYTFKSLNFLKLLDYCQPPVINVNLGTDAGFYGNYLIGLNEGFESIEDYISVTDGEFEFVPSENGNGTGSVLYIYNTKGEIFRSYDVIIFGDINGDSYANAEDAVLLNAAVGELGSLTDAQRFAADVDFDNTAGSSDSDIIQDYSIYMDYISQTR